MPWSGPGLNTLTVGQPLVGHDAWTNSPVASHVSIPSQSGSLLSALTCHRRRAGSAVSIPSQSGSLLSEASGAATNCIAIVSIPSQSGSLLSGQRCAFTVQGSRLNTLTVGQPLVGPSDQVTADGRSQYPHSRAASCRASATETYTGKPGLNTLTVGQPLVGWPSATTACSDGSVSIPSQSGSLLSEPRTSRWMPCHHLSQYPHSRAASCRVGPANVSDAHLNTLQEGWTAFYRDYARS